MVDKNNMYNKNKLSPWLDLRGYVKSEVQPIEPIFNKKEATLKIGDSVRLLNSIDTETKKISKGTLGVIEDTNLSTYSARFGDHVVSILRDEVEKLNSVDTKQSVYHTPDKKRVIAPNTWANRSVLLRMAETLEKMVDKSGAVEFDIKPLKTLHDNHNQVVAGAVFQIDIVTDDGVKKRATTNIYYDLNNSRIVPPTTFKLGGRDYPFTIEAMQSITDTVCFEKIDREVPFYSQQFKKFDPAKLTPIATAERGIIKTADENNSIRQALVEHIADKKEATFLGGNYKKLASSGYEMYGEDCPWGKTYCFINRKNGSHKFIDPNDFSVRTIREQYNHLKNLWTPETKDERNFFKRMRAYFIGLSKIGGYEQQFEGNKYRDTETGVPVNTQPETIKAPFQTQPDSVRDYSTMDGRDDKKTKEKRLEEGLLGDTTAYFNQPISKEALLLEETSDTYLDEDYNIDESESNGVIDLPLEYFPGGVVAQGKDTNVLILRKLDEPVENFDGQLSQYELEHRWLRQPILNDTDEAWTTVQGNDFTYYTDIEMNEIGLQDVLNGMKTLFDLFNLF